MYINRALIGNAKWLELRLFLDKRTLKLIEQLEGLPYQSPAIKGLLEERRWMLARHRQLYLAYGGDPKNLDGLITCPPGPE